MDADEWWEWEEDLGYGVVCWNAARDHEEAFILASFMATATGQLRRVKREVQTVEHVNDSDWDADDA